MPPLAFYYSFCTCFVALTVLQYVKTVPRFCLFPDLTVVHYVTMTPFISIGTTQNMSADFVRGLVVKDRLHVAQLVLGFISVDLFVHGCKCCRPVNIVDLTFCCS